MPPGSPNLTLLAAAGSQAERSGLTRLAFILFLTIAVLLVVLFVVVIALSVSHRRHARGQKKEPRSLEIDAWKAAGERTEPYRPRDDAPRDNEG